jgi:hypothetical protein
MMRSVIAFTFLLGLCAGEAPATPQRTFVASHGNDASACSLAQPCRSFGAAVAKTSAGGEVIVLDSAGYGPVTIAQSISIIAPAGVYAGVTVASGSGITVDGSGIVVVLRGLTINGQGGDWGIFFNQGTALTVEDCEIANMIRDGIIIGAVDSQARVKNTVVRKNGLDGIRGEANSGSIRVTVANSLIADNGEGVGADAFGGSVDIVVARSIVTGNTTAFEVFARAGATASILSDGNTITYSTVVFLFSFDPAGTVIFTAGNNTVGYYGTLQSGGTVTTCCGI